MNKSDYKNVYVFAEQRGGVVQSVALELIGKARDLADALGEKVVAILAGYNVEPLIQTLFEYGADEVVVTDHPELKDYVTEEYAQAVSQIIDAVRPNIVLFGATTIGRDLAPRLSARLATGLTADCTKLEISEDKQLMMTRPAFGGNLMATIMCTEHRPQMSTVRPGVMPKRDPESGRTGSVRLQGGICQTRRACGCTWSSGVRIPCDGGCRYHAARPSGGPDRKDRPSRPLPCPRYLRCHPASCRYGGVGLYRSGQQGQVRAYIQRVRCGYSRGCQQDSSSAD